MANGSVRGTIYHHLICSQHYLTRLQDISLIEEQFWCISLHKYNLNPRKRNSDNKAQIGNLKKTNRTLLVILAGTKNAKKSGAKISQKHFLQNLVFCAEDRTRSLRELTLIDNNLHELLSTIIAAN